VMDSLVCVFVLGVFYGVLGFFGCFDRRVVSKLGVLVLCVVAGRVGALLGGGFLVAERKSRSDCGGLLGFWGRRGVESDGVRVL